MSRAEGRSLLDARPISYELGYTKYAEGSVLARCGETWVLCNASVEDKVPNHCVELGRGWVTAEYAMLPRATHSRSNRDGRSGPPRGRTLEIQRLIGRSLRAVVDLPKLSGFTIRLDCDVLQADGGTRTTAISGSYLAMALAMKTLRQDDLIPEGTLRNPLAAISVGLLGGQVYVDLDYQEDSRAQVDLNLVVEKGDKLVEVQATAEGAPYTPAQLHEMVEAGLGATRKIFELQQSCLAG